MCCPVIYVLLVIYVLSVIYVDCTGALSLKTRVLLGILFTLRLAAKISIWKWMKMTYLNKL